jgi:DNA polymerase V
MKKGSTEDGIVYHAGFPNAAEDQRYGLLNLDQMIVRHRMSTFFWRLDAAGIPELGWRGNSLVVVDRALKPRVNDLVVAVIDEDFVVRKFHDNKLSRPDGSVETSEQVAIWGVITHVVQEYRK